MEDRLTLMERRLSQVERRARRMSIALAGAVVVAVLLAAAPPALPKGGAAGAKAPFSVVGAGGKLLARIDEKRSSPRLVLFNGAGKPSLELSGTEAGGHINVLNSRGMVVAQMSPWSGGHLVLRGGDGGAVILDATREGGSVVVAGMDNFGRHHATLAASPRDASLELVQTEAQPVDPAGHLAHHPLATLRAGEKRGNLVLSDNQDKTLFAAP